MTPPTERDGGAAFATAADGMHQRGMSLRDYAEIHIMAAMISAPGQLGDECRDNPSKAVAWARDQVSDWLQAREDSQ